jgi:hypothetical protein
MQEQTIPPAQVVVQMSMGYQTAQALYVATRLGVADYLADGLKDGDTLAQLTGTHAPSLRRLLRMLASMGVFTEDAQGRFGLTALGASLRADVPESARSRVLMFGQPWMWHPFMELFHSVQTGESAFPRVYGVGYFDYLREHPEANRLFNDGLWERTAPQAAQIAATYDFTGLRTVVDVRGAPEPSSWQSCGPTQPCGASSTICRTSSMARGPCSRQPGSPIGAPRSVATSLRRCRQEATRTCSRAFSTIGATCQPGRSCGSAGRPWGGAGSSS